MPAAIKLGSASNTITLILESHFDQWQKKQPKDVQSWLNANQFKGAGFLLLPSKKEALDVILVVSTLDEFFLAGDLPNQLPEGDYALTLDSEEALPNLDEESKQLINLRFSTSWALAAYAFSRYKAERKNPARLALEDQTLHGEVTSTIDAIYLTRDLINTPASDMMPQHLAETMHDMAKEFQGTFSQVVGEDLLDQNYPLIHAVGRASVHPPRLLELRWGDKNAPAITLVGKGVCFDSGGLNIKVGNFMRNMKKDMGGAAHVLGLARLIMSQNLGVNLRVLVAAAENAISGDAFRPGDVITARNGLTVEIDNTDAEGRLVLCDALDDASSESPDLIIDFATLTGACRVALGTELPGFFCNDEQTAAGLAESSATVLDPIWRLPLFKPYNDMLKSNIADTVNSADTPFGGAITAALYLQKFIGADIPWVHFDVMAWNLRKLPGRPVGGEALGLRAVFEFLKQRYG